MLRMLRVGFDPNAGCWPLSDRTEYPERRFAYCTADGEEVEICTYDPYSAYPRAGVHSLPYTCSTPGDIDNRYPPQDCVIEQMVHDLQKYSQACEAIEWTHGTQCYPTVASRLPELFKLRILSFGDDCPGSSERKTFPILHGFNTYIHRMAIWNYATGERVAEKYIARGIKRCYHHTGGPLDHLTTEWAAAGLSIEKKWKAYLAGEAPPIDLCFIGCIGRMSHARHRFLTELNSIGNRPKRQLALYGKEMRDGELLPIGKGQAAARVVVDVYRRAMFGLNYPVSSLFNGRLYDLMLTGTIQVMQDVHGELKDYGIEAGVHYLPFDGTVAGLFSAVEDAKRDVKRLYRMALEAEKKAHWLLANHGRSNALDRCIADYRAGLI